MAGDNHFVEELNGFLYKKCFVSRFCRAPNCFIFYEIMKTVKLKKLKEHPAVNLYIVIKIYEPICPSFFNFFL